MKMFYIVLGGEPGGAAIAGPLDRGVTEVRLVPSGTFIKSRLSGHEHGLDLTDGVEHLGGDR
jgi:hypothetical protein